jgi:hypothetical protein
MRLRIASAALLLLCPVAARAQEHQHTPGMQHGAAVQMPTQAGQAAFATIQEIARMLEADPATDWSKVSLERLRLHLIDMDLVTMRSRVASTPTAGGAIFTVRGTGEVVAAIKRMTAAHAQTMTEENGPRVVRTELPDGVRLVITSRTPNDAQAAARIRGLGFIGFMSSNDHHQMHHLLLAKGELSGHGH